MTAYTIDQRHSVAMATIDHVAAAAAALRETFLEAVRPAAASTRI